MSTSYSSPLPSRAPHPHIPTTCSNSSCQIHIEFPLPLPPPPQRTVLRVKCWKCGIVFEHVFYPGQVPAQYQNFLGGASAGSSGYSTATTNYNQQQQQSSGPSGGPKKTRKIGTQDKPLETGYYDILGVSIDATSDDIKKAYRRLAIKHHPDKNPDDPTAASRFTQIGIAYQTLSDPALRKKYNEFGAKESQPEGGFVDPEEVFGAIFGGERFVPIIGHIGLAMEMKAALQEEGDGEAEDELDKKDVKTMTPQERARKEEKDRIKAEKEKQKNAEKAAARAERVGGLVENLVRKLSIFTESATGPNDPDVSMSWKTICELEAEDLKRESYGADLLHAIGFVYSSKAKHFLATNQTFLGVGGWLHNVQGKYHVFSETVSTLRAAIELKAVFDQIAAAEKSANGLSPEERRKLEEQAAEKGLQALFKGTKLEIESVLREVCDRVLSDSTLPREKLVLRAVALQMLGEAYMSVKREEGVPGVGNPMGQPQPGPSNPDDEYVRIETKKSRAAAADGQGQNQGHRSSYGR